MELHFEKMLKYAPYFEKGMFYTIVRPSRWLSGLPWPWWWH